MSSGQGCSKLHTFRDLLLYQSNCEQFSRLRTINIGGVSLQLFERTQMKRQYRHLSAYSCDECTGPVIAGSLGVRETEISKESDVSEVEPPRLSYHHRQS